MARSTGHPLSVTPAVIVAHAPWHRGVGIEICTVYQRNGVWDAHIPVHFLSWSVG